MAQKTSVANSVLPAIFQFLILIASCFVSQKWGAWYGIGFGVGAVMLMVVGVVAASE